MFELISRSLRSLRRSPGFFAIAALSLGAALGISTAVYAFIDTITHPVLAYANPSELRYSWLTRGVFARTPNLITQLRDIRRFDGVLAAAGARPTRGGVVANDIVRDEQVDFAAPNFFEVAGLKLRLGRFPSAQETAAGSAVIVSDALWHTEFSNRKVIGDAHLTFRGISYNVVGVLPSGMMPIFNAAVFVPLSTEDQLQSDQVWGSFPIVRLKPGADTVKLNEQYAALAAQYSETNSLPGQPFVFQVKKFKADPLGLQKFQVAMLWGSFALLLIACANVAALLLARGIVRRRDYALRLALGASRTALALEVIAEVTVITLAAGAIGAVIANWGVGGLTSILPTEFVWLGIAEPKWSPRVFAAALGMALFAVAIAGAVPAWLVTRVQPNEPLKDNAGTTTGRAGSRFRYLVIAELSLSMALLLGASLIAKGTRNIEEYEFGYDAKPLLEATFAFYGGGGPSVGKDAALVSTITDRIRSVPGVLSAAAVARVGADNWVATSDLTVAGGDGIRLNDGYFDADAGFFKTLGLPVAQGRDFLEGDRTGEGAAILNAAAAKALFPHGSAIGHRVKMGDFKSSRNWLRVVGVVNEMRFEFRGNDRDFTEEPMIVTSTRDAAQANYFQAVIRPTRGARGLEVAIQRELQATMATGTYGTVGKWVPNYFAVLKAHEFVVKVFEMLGAASLLLGAAGLFSVLTYVVGQRMREFAVRMALGADGPSVVRLVLRSALELSIGGTAVGAFLGMWTGSLLSKYMANVAPTDVTALLIAEGILVAVTMLASLVPALRAARANPVDVLRAS